MPRSASPRTQTLAALRAAGVSTVRELADVTGLSRPTVTQVLTSLSRDGLVDADVSPAPPNERGGRPAARFRFRAERHHVLGLDFSDSRQRLAIADLSGRVVHTQTDGPRVPRSTSADVAIVQEAVEEAFERARLPLDSLAGVTLALPGIVGHDGRLVHSPAFRSWTGVDLGARLTDALGCPTAVENDLVLAALAEARLGAAQFADTSLFLLTWFHVSARLVTGGRVHSGRHRQAGEMGSVRLLSGPIQGDESPWEWIDDVDARIATAASGDPDGQAAVELLTERMAPAVAGLLAAYDPDLVVLGGRLGRHADVIGPKLQEKAAAELDLHWDYPVVGHALGALDSSVGAVIRTFEAHGAALLGSPDAPIPTIALPEVTPTARDPIRQLDPVG